MDNIFKRHKKTTIFLLISLLLLSFLILTEILLRNLYGLGNPVLYDSNPIYGFRPLSNKIYHRFRGSLLKFNNLGLRAEGDWDYKNKGNKVLFLGDSVTFGGSNISNNELFSYLALKDLPEYQSGNAGVNAWGVENIYGLIVEENFTPARYYVITLPEGDFYRGVTRMQGTPFFNNKPKFALLELYYYFCWSQNNHRYKEWTKFANENQINNVIDRAVIKLKNTIEFLSTKGYSSLIFITPDKQQVLNGSKKDPIVFNLLKQNNVPVVYIVDELKKYNLSNDDKEKIFYDGVHLAKRGHEIWAKIIGDKFKDLINRPNG
jgi:hypothetical protein